jgi:uncharacterized repeat protein (TIGR04042 family)
VPEVGFTVRWPDGTSSSFWSPSRVLRSYFGAGTRLSVRQFVELGVAALDLADERVRQKYGFRCGGVAATVEAIRARAGDFGPGEPVEVVHVD